MYAHEYLYTTWRENPTPIVEALRGYLLSDYDYEKDVRQLRENRDAAIKEMWSLVPAGTSQEDKDKLKTALDLALKMTPLTPDHHFYMDQGTYARMRLVLMGVGRKLVELGGLDQPDDIMFLKYDELRKLSANLVDVRRAIASSRSGARAREGASRSGRGSGPARLPTGRCTASPTNRSSGTGRAFTSARRAAAAQPSGSVKGLGASAGVYEGPARVVESAEQFDQVKKGDVLVCKMTSPCMGRALHEDRRARHRFGRRAFASGGRVARVRHSGCRRHTNGNAGHQNGTARAAERSIGAC